MSPLQQTPMTVVHIGTTTVQAPVGQIQEVREKADRALAYKGVPDNDRTLISAPSSH